MGKHVLYWKQVASVVYGDAVTSNSPIIQYKTAGPGIIIDSKLIGYILNSNGSSAYAAPKEIFECSLRDAGNGLKERLELLLEWSKDDPFYGEFVEGWNNKPSTFNLELYEAMMNNKEIEDIKREGYNDIKRLLKKSSTNNDWKKDSYLIDRLSDVSDISDLAEESLIKWSTYIDYKDFKKKRCESLGDLLDYTVDVVGNYITERHASKEVTEDKFAAPIIDDTMCITLSLYKLSRETEEVDSTFSKVCRDFYDNSVNLLAELVDEFSSEFGKRDKGLNDLRERYRKFDRFRINTKYGGYHPAARIIKDVKNNLTEFDAGLSERIDVEEALRKFAEPGFEFKLLNDYFTRQIDVANLKIEYHKVMKSLHEEYTVPTLRNGKYSGSVDPLNFTRIRVYTLALANVNRYLKKQKFFHSVDARSHCDLMEFLDKFDVQKASNLYDFYQEQLKEFDPCGSKGIEYCILSKDSIHLLGKAKVPKILPKKGRKELKEAFKGMSDKQYDVFWEVYPGFAELLCSRRFKDAISVLTPDAYNQMQILCPKVSKLLEDVVSGYGSIKNIKIDLPQELKETAETLISYSGCF